jgi:hypothetical protein
VDSTGGNCESNFAITVEITVTMMMMMMILTGMMIVIMIVVLDKCDDCSNDYSYIRYKILGMLGTFYAVSFFFARAV